MSSKQGGERRGVALKTILKKTTRGEDQKFPILRQHSLWTAPRGILGQILTFDAFHFFCIKSNSFTCQKKLYFLMRDNKKKTSKERLGQILTFDAFHFFCIKSYSYTRQKKLCFLMRDNKKPEW